MNYWAHRGLSRLYPENTLAAFEAACAYDITGIELDVRLTADGEVVVIHDSTVDRTTDGTGAVRDLTLEQIRSLKIPAGLGTENAGRFEHVPTLSEVLELCLPYCRDYGMMVNIETKPDPEGPAGLEEKSMEAVRAFGLARDVLWSSFDRESLMRLKELDPGCRIAVLAKDANNCLQIAEELGADALHPYMRSARDYRALRVFPAQYAVRVWTLQDDEPLYPAPAFAADGYHTGSAGPETFTYAQLNAAGATDLITNNCDRYCDKRSLPVARRQVQAEIQPIWKDRSIDPDTGLLCTASGSFTAAEPIPVRRGDIVEPAAKDIAYRLFYYRAEAPAELILERGDQIESNRTTYTGEYDTSPRFEPAEIAEGGFIRIVFEPALAGAGFNSTCLNKSLEKAVLIRRAEKPIPEKLAPAARAEILRFTDHVKAEASADDILFLLGTDTHYAVGGGWEATAQILRNLEQRLRLSGIIHLGDLTDGVLPPEETLRYARRVLEDLGSSDLPLIACLGEHDCRPFSVKKRTLSRKGAGELYLGHAENFAVGFAEHRLRFIVLNSFNPDDKEPYGFSSGTLSFLAQALRSTPKDHRIILCSHIPPAAEILPQGHSVKNGAKMIAALEKDQSRHGRILAWICGHTHADRVYRKYSFPIVTIGAMQVDYFRDSEGRITTYRETAGSVTPERIAGEASRELFDILAVPKSRNELKFLRYGAGEDRIV